MDHETKSDWTLWIKLLLQSYIMITRHFALSEYINANIFVNYQYSMRSTHIVFVELLHASILKRGEMEIIAKIYFFMACAEAALLLCKITNLLQEFSEGLDQRSHY